MKRSLVILTVLIGSSAFAKTVSVEFGRCSNQTTGAVCAKVYSPEIASGQELRVELPSGSIGDALEQEITKLISARGTSLAMNIDGELRSVHRSFGGSYETVLFVNSLQSNDPSAPRPRGL